MASENTIDNGALSAGAVVDVPAKPLRHPLYGEVPECTHIAPAFLPLDPAQLVYPVLLVMTRVAIAEKHSVDLPGLIMAYGLSADGDWVYVIDGNGDHKVMRRDIQRFYGIVPHDGDFERWDYLICMGYPADEEEWQDKSPKELWAQYYHLGARLLADPSLHHGYVSDIEFHGRHNIFFRGGNRQGFKGRLRFMRGRMENGMKGGWGDGK